MDTETLRYLCDAADALELALLTTEDGLVVSGCDEILDLLRETMVDAVKGDAEIGAANEPCQECGA